MKPILITILTLPILLFAQVDKKKLFTNHNSPLLENNITSIATDNKGLNWIGTLKGLVCYDGQKWATLNTKNSKLPSDKILCIEIVNNTKYIGTTEGLLIIKNDNWEIYTTTNSGLPSNKIRKIKSKNNTRHEEKI